MDSQTRYLSKLFLGRSQAWIQEYIEHGHPPSNLKYDPLSQPVSSEAIQADTFPCGTGVKLVISFFGETH